MTGPTDAVNNHKSRYILLYVLRITWLALTGLMLAILFAAAGIADALLRNVAALPLPVETFSTPLNIIYLVCLVVGLAAQIYRFRHVSSPMERQQTKWVLYGITMLTVCMFLYSLVVEIIPLQAGNTRLFDRQP